MESFDALIQMLRTGRAPHLRREIVEAMTTNETTFFREVGPFDLLRTTVLPRLIEARRDVRKLKFWYAASSTGQEPYSVALAHRRIFFRTDPVGHRAFSDGRYPLSALSSRAKQI
jgi:chemotaxis methyl-accepting protein methylase